MANIKGTVASHTSKGEGLIIVTRFDLVRYREENPGPKRVLVFGGRKFCDYKMIFRFLKILTDRGDTIIHGAAGSTDDAGSLIGADLLAARFAIDNDRDIMAFPIDPKEYDLYRGAAGHMRNRRMRIEGKPDYGIGFVGGTGTADMARQLKDNNIPVIEVIP